MPLNIEGPDGLGREEVLRMSPRKKMPAGSRLQEGNREWEGWRQPENACHFCDTGSVRWSGTGENDENGDEVFMEIKAIATGR